MRRQKTFTPLIMKAILSFCIAFIVTSIGHAQTNYPPTVEGDYIIKDFTFESKESLPQLSLHYTTLGQPVKDKDGRVVNAVLIMHGTTGDGHQFLSKQFAGNLFNAGQLLDATKYYIILPDAIGHGKSSKPSNGLHMKFPKYTYNDMVKADYQLLTEHLGVNHLRLVMGTSMGGMHTWVWGEMYPTFMDALMPLASLPVQIAGRNQMMRRMAMDSIKNDPEWSNGEYKSEPRSLVSALHILMIMSSIPLQWQKQAPTRDAADKFLDEWIKNRLAKTDANDLLYQFDASRNYDPSPRLTEIQAPLVAVNSADDVINPPELGILEREIKHVKRGRAVVLPISD